MADVAIIGAGIIGTTLAKVLTSVGRHVTLLDANMSMAGTPPSGGHLKPSWFGSMPKSEYIPSMDILDKTWGLVKEEFTVWPVGVKATVYRVDTDAVVTYPKMTSTVNAINNMGTSKPVVSHSLGEDKYNLVIVAAGVWASSLVEGIEVIGKRGVSFRYPHRLKEAFIKPWAPYKQVVAHQQSLNEIWVGDGSAILDSNWDETRTKECEERCRKALGASGIGKKPTKILTGIRPYLKSRSSDPCLLKQVGPRVWVATGAGKSGTIAAGWVAKEILCRT